MDCTVEQLQRLDGLHRAFNIKSSDGYGATVVDFALAPKFKARQRPLQQAMSTEQLSDAVAMRVSAASTTTITVAPTTSTEHCHD